MVKFRGKPKKKQEPHIAGEFGVAQVYSAPSGHNFLAKSWRGYPGTTKKIIVSGVVLLLAIGVSAYFFNSRNSDDSNVAVTYLPTEQEGLQKNLSNLKDNPPAQSASNEDKLSYYDKLIVAYANLEDYKGAVKTFEQRQELSESGLDYAAFVTAAMYYHETGDDTNAVLLLRRAETMLPANDDFESGYSRQSVLDGLQKLAKEYSS